MNLRQITKSWVIPVVVSVAIFVVARPILAQQAEEQINLSNYVKANNVSVGSEIVEGYQQIYYEYEGEKRFVTDGNTNHRQPDTEREYIAYVGDINEVGQIFLYHIPTANTIKLTNSGVNLRPQVSKEGRVVWEGWVESRWQIFFYDGVVIRQITQGDLAINPDIEGEYIAYARRDLTDTWRAEIYSILEEKSVDVRTGVGTKRPKLMNGEIILLDEETASTENFDLSVRDMFTLNLAPLVSEVSQGVTEADILEEILSSAAEATGSAHLQEATESSELQTATDSATAL